MNIRAFRADSKGFLKTRKRQSKEDSRNTYMMMLVGQKVFCTQLMIK